MKKITVFISLLLLFCCFVSAGAAAAAEEPAHTDATVFAKCGEIIQITAPANPSTGYNWMISYISPGLHIVEDSITSISTGFVGSGSVYECWVTADTPGFYILNAEYARTWESTPAITLKSMFVYLPDFLNIQSGLISIRNT